MRTLSFWGWGYEDRFPDEAARRGVAQMASALLGGAALEVASPPALEQIALPAPRVDVPAALAGFSSADRRERAAHTYGRSFADIWRGFSGDFSPAPDFVCRPRTEDEIEATMAWAAGARVALIPFGGGTSVVGGVEADVGAGYEGAVSLDLRALHRVLEIDDVSRAARIQAGIVGPALEAALARSGFTLRHFPQSFELSTLGGWLATRAGGHHATLGTHIDDHVESMRMLTPRGPWESARLPASGAGPSPDRLALGSEGTLGVITEAWMRVTPRPRHRSSASVRFGDFGAAVAAARDIAQSGLHPANCRLLDSREARLHQVVADGSNVLLLGFESADHALSPWLDRALAIATGHGGVCPEGPQHRDDTGGASHGEAAGAWRQAFLDAPYLFNTLVSVGCVVDTFETACTWDRFDALHARVVAEVKAAMRERGGGGLLSCRFTHVYADGPAPYYTFVTTARPGEALEQWHAIKRAAADAVTGAGGTITHHHAVGRLHRPWYERQRPEPFALALRAAKAALDPAWILNPGALWGPRDQTPANQA